MKRAIKRLIPASVRPAATALYRALRYSKRPSANTWKYADANILQCAIAYNKYGGYAVPLALRHGTIPRLLFSGKVSEDETIRFITAHCGDGDVVHAGAFIGDFLPALSKACKGKVWAFEPEDVHYRCAAITVQINALSNVELIHAGLGSAPGTAEILIADENGPLSGGARIVADRSRYATVEQVRLVSLDEVVQGRVSLIHLDVEGYEEPALAGALSIISRDRPVLVLETVPHEWVERNLSPLGYRTAGRVDQNTIISA